VNSCKDKKPPEYSMLGKYSPYENYSPERLIGKVQKVIQKGYWAIPDGDAFRKGNRVTIKERKSLYYDWEVIFDESGDIKTYSLMDENNKVFRKKELFKENNILTLATNDSNSVYDKLKCNSEGDIIELSQFSTGVDTLMWRVTFKFSLNRDTLTQQVYDYKGILRTKVIAVVDKDGQFSSKSYYDGNGIYIRGQEFKFNEKRNLIEGSSSYNKDKKLTVDVSFSHFEYDKKGNWIKAIMVPQFVNEGDTVIWERTYTYFE